uniref:Gluconokinase n=1 Tax=Biomphalaria glabrata TaxID=6526 RepID=A0A2C9KNU1_BIOGL
MNKSIIFVIMGVCGSGKTTVAEKLSKEIHCSYRDADNFHSEENKKKMASGYPLTDEDRIPWLLAIYGYIKSLSDSNTPGIVTCSALKRKYRDILVFGEDALRKEHAGTQENGCPVLFVYLKGSPTLISARLKERKGHFMPAELLQSQIDILEEPDEFERHVTVDIDCSVDTIVSSIIKHIK